MEINVFAELSAAEQDEQEALLERPAHSSQDEVQRAVSAILADVRARGDAAVKEYAARFDKCHRSGLRQYQEVPRRPGTKPCHG